LRKKNLSDYWIKICLIKKVLWILNKAEEILEIFNKNLQNLKKVLADLSLIGIERSKKIIKDIKKSFRKFLKN